jgi:hypothetical protein
LAALTTEPVESVTIVTFHFGSQFWVRNLIAHLDEFCDSRVKAFVIVDQSRSSLAELQALPGVSRVLQFPVDDEEVRRRGHDHASAIQRVLEEDFTTSHVLLMDSDCFPVRDGWLAMMPSVCLAGDPAAGGLTHPCFNLLPTDVLPRLDYRRGMDSLGLDTGRLIGLQLVELGYSPTIVKPRQTPFRGRRGSLYLDGAMYHHGSGSFVTSSSQKLSRQIDPAVEAALMHCISEDRFSLRYRERIVLAGRSQVKKLALLRRGRASSHRK